MTTTRAVYPRKPSRYSRIGRIYIAVCVLCLAVIVPGASGSGSTPSVMLKFSLSSDHSESVELGGKITAEQIFVWADADGATSVQFWLNRALTKAPTQTEKTWPFDLMGGTATVARPLTLAGLEAGPHTVAAIAAFPDGSTLLAEASFEIASAGAAETSDSEPSPSTSSGGGDGSSGGGSGSDRENTGEPSPEPAICTRNELPSPLLQFPGPGNTGVPPDADLRVVDGDYHTRSNGEVVSALEIRGRLYIDHDNVTVTCSRVWGMTTNNGLGLRMWSSTLGDPHGVREGSALKWRDYTLRRVDILGTFDGLKAEGNVDVRDTYIHDLYRTTDATQPNGMTHNDGVQISRGTDMTFVNNTFYTWSFSDGETAGAHLLKSPYGDGAGYMTSAFMITDGRGPVRDVLIQGNLIRGRASKYIFVKRDSTGVKVLDNVFGGESRDYPKLLAVNDATIVAGNTLLPVS